MIFKKLFCGHHYKMNRWHWTHGMAGMESRQIEAELRCTKCGKIKYWHITNPYEFKPFIEKYGDKQV